VRFLILQAQAGDTGTIAEAAGGIAVIVLSIIGFAQTTVK
jgi:hypothetical protein